MEEPRTFLEFWETEGHETIYVCFENHVIFLHAIDNLKFNGVRVLPYQKYDLARENYFLYEPGAPGSTSYRVKVNTSSGYHMLSDLLVEQDEEGIHSLNFEDAPTFATENGVLLHCTEKKKHANLNWVGRLEIDNEAGKCEKCVTMFVTRYGKLWTETFYPFRTRSRSIVFLRRFTN